MSDQLSANKPTLVKTEPQLVRLNQPKTTIQLNNSLNIVTKKPTLPKSNNSVFIVPSSNTTAVNSDNAHNKVTLMSLNTSSISNDTTKIPSALNSVGTLGNAKNFITSPISKKIIINNNSNNLIAPGNAPTSSVNIVNKPASHPNTKIFTIAANSNTNLVNTTNINTVGSSFNTNKVQYVKILNTRNNPTNLQVQQQNNTTKSIKITTISANTNTNAITTTTTNSENSVNGNSQVIYFCVCIDRCISLSNKSLAPNQSECQKWSLIF